MIVLFKILFLLNIKAENLDSNIFNTLTRINNQQLVHIDYGCANGVIFPIQDKVIYTSNENSECAKDLCGPPDPNNSAFIRDLNFSKSIPQSLKEEMKSITPLVNDVINKAVELNIRSLDKLKDTFTNKNLAKLNIQDLDYDQLGEFEENQYGPYLTKKIDMSSSYPNRIRFTLSNLPKSASPVFLKALEDYRNLKEKSENVHLEDKTLSLYSSSELKEIARLQLNDLIKYFEENKSKLESDTRKEIDISILRVQKLIKAGKERSALSNIQSTFFYFYEEVKDFKSNYGSSNCKTKNCDLYLKDFIKTNNPSAAIDSMMGKLNSEDAKKSAVNRCLANIAFSKLKKADDISAMTLFQEAKKAVIDRVLPKFSEHSRMMLKEFLNNQLKIATDIQRKNKVIDDPVDSFKNKASSFLSNGDEDSVNDDLLSPTLLSIKNNMTKIDPFSVLSSPCSDGYQFSATDAFLPHIKLSKSQKEQLKKEDLKDLDQRMFSQNTVFISDFSCNHQKIGKQAIAHEIGHALAHAFKTLKLSSSSSKLYSDARKCMSDAYKMAPKDENSFFKGDKIFTEEDMADQIAFAAFPDERPPFACNLLLPSSDFKTFAALELINPSGTDTHSSSLFRVLNETISKGIDLPKSCQKVIKNNPEIKGFNKCL
jgi:hypothetical protein